MKVNFKISENCAVLYHGRHIDLHNNFLFNKYIEENDCIKVFFKRSDGHWVEEDEFKTLVFICTNTSYFYYEEGDNSIYPEDENILSYITFFPKRERDINDAYIDRKDGLPQENDDIIFSFENEKTIRINCESIRLEVN
ncbi:hypothetical protein [Aquimarina rhabdastrellae]